MNRKYTVIGADLRYDLSRRWFLAAKGTVGGFGVSSDISCDVFGGVGFHITDWCSATLGYRYLHEEYNRNQFEFNMDAHGFLLGVGFHFDRYIPKSRTTKRTLRIKSNPAKPPTP
jgi:opacity protein-like surface antigen